MLVRVPRLFAALAVDFVVAAVDTYTAEAADCAPCPTFCAASLVARAALDAEALSLRNIELAVASSFPLVESVWEPCAASSDALAR